MIRTSTRMTLAILIAILFSTPMVGLGTSTEVTSDPLDVDSNRAVVDIPIPGHAILAGTAYQPGLSGTTHYLVQFHATPTSRIIPALRAAGGEPLEYLGAQTWIVTADSVAAAIILARPDVAFVQPILPAWKVHPKIAQSPDPNSVNVILFDDGEISVVADRINSLGGTVERIETVATNRIEADLPFSAIDSLAELDEVAWIQALSEPISVMDDVTSNLYMGIDTVQQIGGYTGAGILGEVHDSGYYPAHPDLGNMIYTDGGNSPDYHGTLMSGLVFGTGTGDIRAQGVMPGGIGAFAPMGSVSRTAAIANLWAGNFDQGFSGQPGLFQTNSFGNTPFDGEYLTNPSDVDTSLNTYPYMTVVWASGNSNSGVGPGMIIRTCAAKNVLCVGSVWDKDTAEMTDDDWHKSAETSSPPQGPTPDFRVKPELVGPFDNVYTLDVPGAGGASPGDYSVCAGNSCTAPIVAGTVGLVYEMYADGFFGTLSTGPYPLSSTIKALLIADAQQYPLEQIERFHQGWGVPDLQNLYWLGADLHVIEDGTATVDAGTNWSRSLWVPGSVPLHTTLVWIDPAAAGNTGTARTLINNLDLHLTAPDGTEYWGNNGMLASHETSPGTGPNDWSIMAPDQADDLNNVENVWLTNPQPGWWTVEVLGRAGDLVLGPQNFSLVASGAAGNASHGRIYLDSPTYFGEDTIQITLADFDLNTDSGAIEVALVFANGTTDPAGEVVSLTETGLDTGVFTGALDVSLIDSVGILGVSQGETIQVVYADADIGGGVPGSNRTTAYIDPIPQSPTLTSVTQDGQILQWFRATSDIMVAGVVTGNYTETTTSDNTYQSIMEIESGGAPANRYSYLEHKWTIPVAATDPLLLSVDGFGTLDYDPDDYVFAFSTDDAVYTDAITVTGDAKSDPAISATLPSGTNGTVYIRVQDTDRSAGQNWGFSLIYIDDLFIEGATTPPSPQHNLLEWTLSPDDGAGMADVVGYNIYRSTSPAGPWDGTTLVTMVAAGNASFTDANRGTADGTYWWYVVRAVDDLGQEDDNALAIQEPAPPDLAPPFADAGPDQSGGVDLNVTFDGSASTDDIGIIAYWWNFTYQGANQTLTGTGPNFLFKVPGSYLVTLEVADAAGNQDSASMWVNATGFALPVVSGWNLLSFPTDATGDPSIVLSDSSGDGATGWSMVWAYDPATGWSSYSPSRPAMMNDLTLIDRDQGLWVNITTVGDGYLTGGGTYPGSGSIPLGIGWNLVGFPSEATGQTVASALSGVAYSAVIGWNITTEYRLATLAGSAPMGPGLGYWVATDAVQAWALP